MNNSQSFNLDANKMPNHIAIIMDGNGRWAKKRLLPRVAGHKAGMENVRTIAKAASNLGIKVLTLYAFSTENWKRPTDEVNYLMKLPIVFFDKFVPELIENNIKVNIMGYLDQLPQGTQKACYDAIEQTKNNTGMILNFALNYGSRAEIVSAAQKLVEQAGAGEISSEDINEEVFAKQLMTSTLGKYADPDLLIRTSGEERISNFLLWQLAYSELIFDDCYWPDFSVTELQKNIWQYQQRDRRFGGLK